MDIVVTHVIQLAPEQAALAAAAPLPPPLFCPALVFFLLVGGFFFFKFGLDLGGVARAGGKRKSMGR